MVPSTSKPMNTLSVPTPQPGNSCWDLAERTNKDFALNTDKENLTGF
jgi:hypothetical protein